MVFFIKTPQRPISSFVASDDVQAYDVQAFDDVQALSTTCGCCFSSTSGEDGGVELSLASAPSIKISAHDTCNCMTEYKDECNVLTSYGLDDTSLAAAFANTCLEQDRSYWEIHLRTNLPPTSRLVVGLSKKMKANSISSLCEKLLSDPNPMPFEVSLQL
ncbi:hypothetical protein TL16_g06198 [Triparma laevis f. inornata]|uniref:Uncharacterized protein n=1 Tax=Triparma laevis f. inornata TaxID=1714386 RepID=A0A9W7EC44_9STRA|nr:hypothetical protein TL16_g06198 [Triparma laevis f. inornata]